MKILIDMNLSPDWVQVFVKYEIESVHWSNIGDPRATDRVIMNWASINGEDVRQIEAEIQQVDRSTIPGKIKGKLKSRSQLRRTQSIATTSSLETLQTLRSEARY